MSAITWLQSTGWPAATVKALPRTALRELVMGHRAAEGAELRLGGGQPWALTPDHSAPPLLHHGSCAEDGG